MADGGGCLLLSLPALETLFPPGGGFASGVPTRDARLPGSAGTRRGGATRADVRSLWERVGKENHAETIRCKGRRNNSTFVGHKGVPLGFSYPLTLSTSQTAVGRPFSFCSALMVDGFAQRTTESHKGFACCKQPSILQRDTENKHY